MVEATTDEQLLELLYLCPVAIAKLDKAGGIVMMNPMGVQLLMQVAPNGALDNLYELLREAAPEVGEMVRRFPAASGRICDEYRIFIRGAGSGRERTYTLSLTLQKIDAETVVAVIGDVTSAALREKVVRTNEARLFAVFDGVKDYAIATFDLLGVVTSWNRSAEIMHGYRADEIIGRSGNVFIATGAGSSGVGPLLERARRDGWCEQEGWRIRKDGSRFWANSVISVLRDRTVDALLGYSMITRDVTERKRSDDGLRRLAATDALTGALNRRAFLEAAVREELPFRTEGRPSAILMLDVDGFKGVNDELGHAMGDGVLRSLVAAAQTEMAACDVIGRYGGEEFLILLPGSDADTARDVAERIRGRVADTVVEAAGCFVSVTVSIGVAAMGDAYEDVASTIRAADEALYAAKRAGRNRVESAPSNG